MPGDKRRIQTAVLGGAESEVPLILPLEAIELDAFRRHHAEDTFWCGLLLGGCGTQLTTKLYTDRVCHFAHLPDPTGLHVCGRRARDVASADHLYVKSAAIAWLLDQDHAGAVHLREPLGSVVDIAWEHGTRGLRLHLDAAVAPVWDDETLEPVLGVSVPVDDETLVRRRFVHRVGFDSVGTTRQVRIGTQAFAQETEWFGLGECSMTPDGFRTPAVERIVRTHRTGAPRGAWRLLVPEGRRTEPHPARRRLEAALASGSRVAVESAYRDLEATGPDWGPATQEVAAELEKAQAWLDGHHREREKLFESLRQAVQGGDTGAVRTLLARVNAKARDRTSEHHGIAIRAVNFLRNQERAARARRNQEDPESAAENTHRPNTPKSRQSRPAPEPLPPPPGSAQRRVRDILSDLRRLGNRMGPQTMLHALDSLTTVMEIAGDLVTPAQRAEAERWIARGRRLRAANTMPAPRQTTEDPAPRNRPEVGNRAAHAQVSRILSALGRNSHQMPNRELCHQARLLAKEAKRAGSLVTPAQRQAVDRWLARAERLQPPSRPGPAGSHNPVA
ncbi:hypothetical protein ACFU7Y_32105 [Kitasatospora sp. NPDC057542]|uniref:hypothetical protein n=1 Tax=Kitasatospora sp. NPDC057542 TaxID=3346162 RepID=UPI0036969A27